MEPQTREQEAGIQLRKAELGPGGPILETEEVLEGSYLMRVLTPCGDLQQVFEQPGVVLRLSRELQAEYHTLVAGLPAGMPVLLRLEASFGPARSTWTMLRIP